MSDEKGDLTELLGQLSAGDRSAEERLISQVYMELHRLAYQHMRGERNDHTLQPTALVNEVYLRLCRQHSVQWQDRGHFFRIAGRLMRRILVDHARQKQASKRGAGQPSVPLEDMLVASAENLELTLEIDDLLKKLALLLPRQAQVAELRFFAGLTEDEIATAVGLDVRTVKRDWFKARAWLYEQIAASRQ
jgi:RNA polymerase sigma factor (TIGR02999 family)